MSTSQIAVRNLVTIVKDGLSWGSGANSIVFPESLANTEYTRVALAPGRIITYTGSKLQTGFAINSDGVTTEGYYSVTGESLIYRDTAVVGASLVQRIIMPLIEGENVITFAAPFADAMWVAAWATLNINIYIVQGSKLVDGVTIFAAEAAPDFAMTVSGLSA